MHGFASLVVEGARPLDEQRTRIALLEPLLDFAFVGLCGVVDGWHTMKDVPSEMGGSGETLPE